MSINHPALEGFPVIVTLPLQWGDMDAFGHVNNTLYLRWAESARIEYFARVGLWAPSGPLVTGPILAAISCNYRIPLTFPDSVHAGARVTAIGNSSFKMIHRIVSAAHEAIAADLESTLVFYDYSAAKAMRLPDDLRAAIEQLEATPA